MSEREYIVIEVYIGPLEKLWRAVKRIIGTLFSPFSTFESIADEPDFIGPLLMIIIYLIFTLLGSWLYYSRITINFIKNETVVSEINAFDIIKDPRTLILSSMLSLMRIISGWILGLMTLWIINGIIGGKASGRALISASGYVISLILLDSLSHLITFYLITSEIMPLVIRIPHINEPLKLLPLIRTEASRQLMQLKSPLIILDKFLWILFRAWILGVLVALANAIMGISILKSIIVAIVCFLAFMFGGWIS